MKAQGSSRGLSLAVIASVGVVFALAYVDLRREEARAFEDFSAEQATLARTLAATGAAHLGGVVRDLGMAMRTPASAAALAESGGYEELDLLDGDGNIVRSVEGATNGERRAVIARL